MFRVLTCLSVEHDWRLVLLAGMVCFIASFAAVTVLRRAKATQGRMRTAWLVTAGTVTGWGIWSTHFIAMLAYDPGFAVGYDPILTGISLLLAVGLTSFGLWLALSSDGRFGAACGGIVVGGGVAAMHYLGMAALQMPGRIAWDKGLVAASIIAALLFGGGRPRPGVAPGQTLVVTRKHGPADNCHRVPSLYRHGRGRDYQRPFAHRS